MSKYTSLTIALDESKVGPKRYATIFPYEIWRECFMLLSIKDCKSVARTCHLFHDICLPFILKSITYSLNFTFHRTSLFGYMASQLEEFHDHEVRFLGLIEDERSRSLVRQLTLAYSLRIAPRTDEIVAKSAKEAYDMYLETFVNCAPLFSNIREVNIRFNKNLDKKLFYALATLPQIEQLSFFSVKFGAHVSKPLIKVRKLLIDNRDGHDSNPIGVAKRLEIFSGEGVEELKIFSRAYAPKLFRVFADHKALKRLTHLSFQIHPRDISTLEPFLAKCPKLEFIKADFGNHYFLRTTSTLPLSTIQHLNSFTGYDEEVQFFVPGRPVRRVVLVQPKKWTGPPRTNEQLQQLFNNLSESTGPIYNLELDIRITPELMASITARFPNLSRLGLQLGSFTPALPDEDPHDIPFDDAVIDQLLPKGGFATEHNPSSAKPFPQIHLFTVYMHILHWIALKRITIPARLESLFLQEDYYAIRLPEVPHDPDSLYPFGNRVQHIRDLFDDHFQRIRYTGFTAELVFKTLSIYYPTLREIVIGVLEVNEIRWKKDADGNWSCSRVSYR